MDKTVFNISKMDCPSEENLIRMKLDGIQSIAKLSFDIPNRTLTVFHRDQLELIEESINELNLGSKKIATEKSHQKVFLLIYCLLPTIVH